MTTTTTTTKGTTMPNIPREWRIFLYAITAAIIPLLVAYRVITAESAPLWLNLAAALLGTVAPLVAVRNIPPKE